MFALSFRHLRILFFEELRDLLGRPRAVIVIALYIVSVALVLYGLLSFDTEFGELLKNQDSATTSLRKILAATKLEKYAVVLDHMKEWPILFPVFQFYLLFWLPTFVSLVSCDMIATDRSRGTLRFLFLKTTRWRYYFSKFLAHLFLYIGLQAFALILFAGGMLYNSTGLTLADLQSPLLLCFVMFIPYALFVLSFVELISVMSRGAMSALLRIHFAWFILMCLMMFWGNSPITYSDFTGVVFPFEGFARQTLLVLGGWSVAFFALGFFIFRRKEI